MLHSVQSGSLGLACQSGWMTSELFVNVFGYFLKFINSLIFSPALLVMDNHKSHLSAALDELACDHEVTIVTLPPHCSHRLQPWHVSL